MGRAGQNWLGYEGVQAETCPRVHPALPASCHLYLFVCVFCRGLASIDSDFVGQRAPRHQKQLKAASICPLDLCLLMSVPGAYVFLFDFVKFVCAVHKFQCVFLILTVVQN